MPIYKHYHILGYISHKNFYNLDRRIRFLFTSTEVVLDDALMHDDAHCWVMCIIGKESSYAIRKCLSCKFVAHAGAHGLQA